MAGADVYPARIADPTACDRFVLREVRGFDPAAPVPLWMRVRLARCGVRSVSLAVDVTNYLMLELGQPLHAFDRSKLTGEIVVRRAQPGEQLETLDHVVRTLHPDDILITDAVRADLHGRHHGRPEHRDRRGLHRPGHRGGALLGRGHGQDEPPPQAAQRGVLPVRARRRPRASAARQRQGGGPAVRPGRRPGGAGLHARLGRGGPGASSRWRPTTRTGWPAWPTAGTPWSGGCARWAARSGKPGSPPRPSPPGGRRARGEPPPPVGRAAAGGRARGDPAELAAGPDRPGRPGRGGHPAGRLRERPGPDAARAGRARAHPAAAAAPVGRPDAGRGRLRGGAVVAVRAALRRGPARAASRRLAPPGGGGGEPAQRGRAAAAHDRAAGAVPGPGPQRRAGLRRHRAVRDRPGLPAPARRAGVGADPPGRPRPHGGRARLPRGRPAGPAAADRRRADRGARARRLVG